MYAETNQLKTTDINELKPISEIQNEIIKYEIILNQLDRIFTQVQEKLQSVLTKEELVDIEQSDKKESEPKTHLGKQLSERNYLLQSHLGHLTELLNQIKL